jgi:lycopene beta-cyclase
MQIDTDVLILGGGCAGLSVGVRLAERSINAVIMESRSAYGNDRTWCFWRHREHRWEHLVSHTWSRMTLSSAKRNATVNCLSTPYQMIEADAFYVEAQRIINASMSVKLNLSERVSDSPKWIDNRWHVRTTSQHISARYLIDTRPTESPQLGGALLWQSFLGEVVVCERPIFDADTVGLMHFVETVASRETDGILFTYVLPFSPQRALIESTVFGTHPLSADALTAHQARAVAQWCAGNTYQIERTENGILPMGIHAAIPVSTPNYIRAGLMSGGARASTGYAFQRIQRWADQCAESLSAGRGAIGHAPDSAIQRGMDRLFLRVIRDYPDVAPDMFVRLFSESNATRTIRFLSDEATLADRAATITALPPAPFLRTLLRAESSTNSLHH